MSLFILVAFVSFTFSSKINVPKVLLTNAAVPDLHMPIIGLGAGGYGSNASVGYGGYPECWIADLLPACTPFVQKAAQEWLDVGGRRIDTADSYYNDDIVGPLLQNSGVERKDLFILAKVGPSRPLGYNETLHQLDQILANYRSDYVDLLLIHWPEWLPSEGLNTSESISSDPFCNITAKDTFNAKECRISTWKAMIKIFENGKAKAIGVSNYYREHIQEIMDAGLILPAANQVPFHIYRSSSQMDELKFMQKHNITYIAYSPFGIPDWHTFPLPKIYPTPQFNHPVVQKISKKYNRPASQIILNWLWKLDIPTNPRSQNRDHMIENLGAYDFSLKDEDVHELTHLPQIHCAIDPDFYECVKHSNETVDMSKIKHPFFNRERIQN